MFDYNKMPMSILGTQTLAYNMPEAQRRWESHGEDGLYIVPCYFHYQLMEHFITATRSHRKRQSSRSYPTHCRILSILEANKSIFIREPDPDVIFFCQSVASRPLRQYLDPYNVITNPYDGLRFPVANDQFMFITIFFIFVGIFIN